MRPGTSHPSDSSRRKAAEAPPPALFSEVADAVVEAVPPALPEFDLGRHQPVPPPVRRPRHVPAGEPRGGLGELPFQGLASRDHLALARRPRADPAALRTRAEILVRLAR